MMAQQMTTDPVPETSVERFFPIVLKANALLIGRESLRANKGKLHFVLITTDIIEAHREEVLRDFMHYPVVQHYTAADFERLFHIKGAKAVGFTKSGFAQAIYAELKPYRINRPVTPGGSNSPKNPAKPATGPAKRTA
jgi:hypothetical protein